MLSHTYSRGPDTVFISVCAVRAVCVCVSKSENGVCFIFMSTKVRAGLIFHVLCYCLLCVHFPCEWKPKLIRSNVLCMGCSHTHAVRHIHTPGMEQHISQSTHEFVCILLHMLTIKITILRLVLKQPSKLQQQRQLYHLNMACFLGYHINNWISFLSSVLTIPLRM